MRVECPNCKNTKFSVRVIAYQLYYGDDENEFDRWREISAEDVEDGKKPYLCCECGKEFEFTDLRQITTKQEVLKK